MKKIGILGLGEVGKAIKLLSQKSHTVFTKDLDHDEIESNRIDILHVCIPYSASLIGNVIDVIQQSQPKLVIIDATVAPGTTRALAEAAKVDVVHSPIMGVHPNLAEYQTQFTKVVGALSDQAFEIARDHWIDLGAPEVVRFDSPEDSELAKLLSTTYYGWNIIFNKLVKAITEKSRTNFEQVYTQFNEIYNQGYAASLPHVRRPVLKHVEGPIGGHCVIPNINILASKFDEPLFNMMLEFNEAVDKKS